MILTIFESYVILDLLDESPRSLVTCPPVPWPPQAAPRPATKEEAQRRKLANELSVTHKQFMQRLDKLDPTKQERSI